MITVHKYTVSLDSIPGVYHLTLPGGAELLSVANQREEAVLWARVDTNDFSTTVRKILFLQTGGNIENYSIIPNYLHFLGTILFTKATYIIHVFEVLDPGD